jgi:hypothetical protein
LFRGEDLELLLDERNKALGSHRDAIGARRKGGIEVASACVGGCLVDVESGEVDGLDLDALEDGARVIRDEAREPPEKRLSFAAKTWISLLARSQKPWARMVTLYGPGRSGR